MVDNDVSLPLEMVSGLEALRQRAEQRLSFLLGEWFLETQSGLPYLTDVVGYRGRHGNREADYHGRAGVAGGR